MNATREVKDDREGVSLKNVLIQVLLVEIMLLLGLILVAVRKVADYI